jgi:3-phytase
MTDGAVAALVVAASVVFVLAGCGEDEPASLPSGRRAGAIAVRATAETAAADGDHDDPAVWVHPTDPGLSLIIGTDKEFGLRIYSMDGAEIQSLALGKINNVDVRYGFPLGDAEVDLVGASHRRIPGAILFRVDPQSRTLIDVAPGGIEPGTAVYGFCMFHDRRDDAYYYFINNKDGDIFQYRIRDAGDGTVAAERVRTLSLESQPEGCVADDDAGYVFVGEEAVGVWRFGARPEDATTATFVDGVGHGRLVADVEGLAIYRASETEGYLLVSSQGDDTFGVYDRRPPHAYRGRFQIVLGAEVDAVAESDGIEVVNVPLGPAWPNGLFVAHDDLNEGFTKNFKLVDWATIANAWPEGERLVVQPNRWSPRPDR